MREVCFCGRVGEIADREPVYAGDGEWGLACPSCGHLDRMTLFPAGERHRLLEAAARRRREAQQNDRGRDAGDSLCVPPWTIHAVANLGAADAEIVLAQSSPQVAAVNLPDIPVPLNPATE